MAIERKLTKINDNLVDVGNALRGLTCQVALMQSGPRGNKREIALEWAKKLNTGGTTTDVLKDAADVLKFLEGGDGKE